MNILVKQTKDTKFVKLREQFEKMDKDGTGLITPQELKQFFDENDQIDIGEDEVKTLISELDYAGNGKINYSEFLAATIDT